MVYSDLTELGTFDTKSFPFTATDKGILIVSNISTQTTGDCYLYLKKNNNVDHYYYRAIHSSAAAYGELVVPMAAGENIFIDAASSGIHYNVEFIKL